MSVSAKEKAGKIHTTSRFGLVSVFVVLFALNFLFRAPFIFSSTYLNEDPALLMTAQERVSDDLGLSLFYTAYGPRVIRPFQILGIYIESELLGLGPVGSQFIGLVILTAAQSILWVAMALLVGGIGATIAVLPIGWSMLSSEAILWISDRHDLYLLLAAAISFWVTSRFLAPRGRWWLLAGLFVAYWFGFYSNEKSTALPPALFLFAVLRQLALGQKLRSEQSVRTFLVGVVGGVALLSYFGLRYAVIGTFVGGYDDRILPEGGLSVSIVFGWLGNMLTLPLRQPDRASQCLAIALLGPAIGVLIGYWWYRTSKLKRMSSWRVAGIVILSLGLVCTVSLPVFKYNLNTLATGVMNSRMQFSPFVSAALCLGALFGAAFRLAGPGGMRFVVGIISIQYLVSVALGGRQRVEAFADASRLTERAVEIFQSSCGCVTLTGNQAIGLPVLYEDVNVFTEKVWIEFHGLAAGMSRCDAGETECLLQYTMVDGETLLNFPHRYSSRRLAELRLPKRIARRPGRVSSFVEFATPLRNDHDVVTEYKFSGWAFETVSKQPVRSLQLFSNGRAIAFLPPNVPRSDVLSGASKASVPLSGFEFYVPNESLTDEMNDVKLFVEYRGEKHPQRALIGEWKFPSSVPH